jgi:hypothetical protein
LFGGRGFGERLAIGCRHDAECERHGAGGNLYSGHADAAASTERDSGDYNT